MRLSLTLVILLVALTVMGCHTVGSKTVRGAQAEYSTGLSYSWNKQLLLNLVRLRYGEAPLFLETTSLSTQHSFEMGANFSPLWDRSVESTTTALSGAGLSRSNTRGDSGDEYGHSANLGYYERPTVTYTPLQGEDFVTRAHTPVSFDQMLLLMRSGWDPRHVMALCTQRLNGLDNASPASGPTPRMAPDYEEFARMLELSLALSSDELSDLVFEEDEEGTHLLFTMEENDPRAQEWRALLGLDPEATRFEFRNWTSRPEPSELSMQTRSFVGIMYYLCNAVAVPETHREKGWVVNTVGDDGAPFDWSEVTGKFLTVHSSVTPPTDAFVSARHEGHWFYIVKSDMDSKYTFAMLRTLFSLLSGDPEKQSPTLTLPVGR